MSLSEQQKPEYHEFIIIGGGIAGLQAALILAENGRDFALLQASDTLGGRIRTQKLKDVIQSQKISPKPWINQQILNTPVQVGATWVSKEHSYILKMMQNYQISLFPQYSDGLVIYGVNEQKYQRLETLTQFYKKYQKQVVTLVNKIQNLTLNMQELCNSNDSPAQGKLLEEYIKYYDNITVSQYIKEEIEDQELADIIMNEMETLECISCDKFSVLQLIDDNSCMQLLRLYCEKVDDNIDGLKVKDGMMTLINKMKQNIFEVLQQNQSEFNKHEIIQFNSPVTEIINQLGQDVIIKLKNGKKFSCMKVLFSVPLAVASQVKIFKISPSKQMIFQNQEYGSVTRFYFVFPEAFWRGKYSGYCSFSRKFPFNELTQLSPSSLTCGIVGFVFVHNKFQMWEQQTRKEHPQLKDVKPLLIDYMLKVMADMFLDGNRDSPLLKEYFTYMRSFKQMQFIRAAYQTTTKPQIWKQITESGDDYRDCYSRDEYNIIYIGSEIQDADDFGTYMEGALRVTRKKIYQNLGKQDPWNYLRDQVIEW